MEKRDYAELQALYNRGGFSRGYYQLHNGPELMSLSRPGHFEGKGRQEMKAKQEYESLLERLHKEYLEKDKKEKNSGNFQNFYEIPHEFVVKYKETEICVTGKPAQKAEKRPMTREDLKKTAPKDWRYAL